jgi:hypothetical protein
VYFADIFKIKKMMKRLLILLFCVVLVLFIIYWQEWIFFSKNVGDADSSKGVHNKYYPILVEENVDYGIVLRGQVIEGNILLKNDSSETYEVIEVQTTCNCSSAFLANSNILVSPGLMYSIPFSINTSGKLGQSLNTFTILYKYDSTSEIRRCSFQVDMDVWQKGKFRINPSSLLLENYVSGNSINENFEILFMPFDDDTEKISIKDVIAPDWLLVRSTDFQKKGSVYIAQLTVSGIPPCFLGDLSRTVKICINDQKLTQITIPMLLSCWSPIKFTPQQICKIVKKEDFPIQFSFKMEFQEQCEFFLDKSSLVGLEQFHVTSRLEKHDCGKLLLLELACKQETTNKVHKGYYQFNVSIGEKTFLVSLPIFLILN